MKNMFEKLSTDLLDPTEARILLADDDPRMLSSLSDLLGHHGYTVDCALGGLKAIEKLSSGEYDLLLLDLKMPYCSGHDVMGFMAESSINTLTIVVSGETSLDDISQALRHGAYDYLKKPYLPEELTATLNNAVRKKLLENSNELMRARLDRSEQLHRYIVNNSSDIIFMLDEQGRFTFLNSKVCGVLAYSLDALIGKHITVLVEESERAGLNHLVARAMNSDGEVQALDLAIFPHNQTDQRHFEISLWKVGDGGAEDQFGPGPRHIIYGNARDITERVQAEEVINFQAYHDLLTGLPNRALFKDRLSVAVANAKRSGAKPAVMFIDLDRFKIINDSLGHTMGDSLLQAVCERFQQCIRNGDTLSRFGGDEFTLLLPDVPDSEIAGQVADKMLASIKRPFEIKGHKIYIGASIGVSIYPEGGDTLDRLIKSADVAMYKVKKSGKNGYKLFSAEMTSCSAKRLQLEQDLRLAVENDEIEICYQPQIDVDSLAISGVEALVRWNHPTLGRLSPAEFIPIAEECNMIAELDMSTLRRGCRELMRHARQGPSTLRLAVNLSPLLIEKDSFVPSILDTLKEEGFPASMLELEITEGLLISDRQDIVEKLNCLTAAGIRLAIDDFGTGYSSLSYLHKFPINTLKIDRSFVHAIKGTEDDASLVNAIVSMARGLKIGIVAEGVESRVQLDYLKNLGCDVVQGFLFGRAAPLEDMAAQVRRRVDHLADREKLGVH